MLLLETKLVIVETIIIYGKINYGIRLTCHKGLATLWMVVGRQEMVGYAP